MYFCGASDGLALEIFGVDLENLFGVCVFWGILAVSASGNRGPGLNSIRVGLGRLHA